MRNMVAALLLMGNLAWAGPAFGAGAGISDDTTTTTTTTSTSTSNSTGTTVITTDKGDIRLGSLVKGSAINRWHRGIQSDYVYARLNASESLINAIAANNGGLVPTAASTYISAVGAQNLPSNYELLTANLTTPSAWIYYNGEVACYTKGVRFESPTKLDGFNAATVAHSIYNGRGAVYSNTLSEAGTQRYVINATTTSTETTVTQQTTTDTTASEESVTVGDFTFVNNVNLNSNTNSNTNTNVQTIVNNITGTGLVDVYEANAQVGISPIVLDLSRSGKLDASEGAWMPHAGLKGQRLARFDINGNGMEMLLEWVGPKAGLLVEPKASGAIDGTCLFGTTGGFEDGFEKLALRDANNDGRLNGAELKGLCLWVDANANARPEAGEVKSLAAHKITELSVRHDQYRSSFVMNGKKETMWDWWPTAVDVRKVRIAKQ